MMIAMQMVPRVIVSFGGAAALLAALSPMLALPVVVWIVLNVVGLVRRARIRRPITQGGRSHQPGDGGNDGRLLQHCHGQTFRRRR